RADLGRPRERQPEKLGSSDCCRAPRSRRVRRFAAPRFEGCRRTFGRSARLANPAEKTLETSLRALRAPAAERPSIHLSNCVFLASVSQKRHAGSADGPSWRATKPLFETEEIGFRALEGRLGVP